MNFREMNLRVFQRKPIPQVFFQPRFEPWYEWHRIFNSLPPAYAGMSLLELYDHVGASMRTVHYYTGQPDPIRREFDAQVTIRDGESSSQRTVVYETPHGELVEGLKLTPDQTWRTVTFPVKNVQDLKALRWLYAHTQYHFSEENFAQGSAYLGMRGEPQFWVPKSPYQALAQQWMRLEDLIYTLADSRREVEETMRVIDDAYDGLYEELTASPNLHILNFGENLHEQLMSPRYFAKYFFPFYEKRVGQLRAAGIYTHVHMDGFFKNLLPQFKDLPFDGLEALTPVPQGDVTLEEIKEHIGNKILLDGIPAVYFLPTYSREELMACVERLVDLFHPNLVLGVSDEVPEGADGEAIERLKLVAQYCRERTFPMPPAEAA